jgi:2-methylcitrate dehydratase PrpD
VYAVQELWKLAQYINQLNYDNFAPEVSEAASYAILDSIGAALGAARQNEITRYIDELLRWETEPERSASVWGTSKRASLHSAVLLNGIMGHALELDDVHVRSKSHVGAVVVISAWTMADALDIGMKGLIEAVVAGYEVMGRIGMSLNVTSHRLKGFHATGTMGVFGAAAVAAKLLGLNVEQTVSAFGIAGTQASGLWAFLAEGSTCKKLHPARAASNGIAAALLAKAGMTGPTRILDAKDGGLYHAMSDGFDMSLLTAGLGETWEITKIDKKPYPCCRSTHPEIDAAFQLRSSITDTKLIESIVVETYEIGAVQCGSAPYPASPVKARFSIAYCVAAALIDGNIGLSHFTQECVDRADLKVLAEKVTVRGTEKYTARYPGHWGCCMKILANNNEFNAETDDAAGSVNCPMTREQEKNKFLTLASSAISRKEALDIIDAVLVPGKKHELPKLYSERKIS